jgi:uncharacterized membrane protein
MSKNFIDDKTDFANIAKKLLVTGVVFICVDGVFLTLMGKTFNDMIVKIQSSPMKIKSIPAALQFVIASICYNMFILKDDPFWKAGVLGACVNGIYETTNYAIFDDYDPNLVIIDTAWGFGLYGSVHTIVQKIMTKR